MKKEKKKMKKKQREIKKREIAKEKERKGCKKIDIEKEEKSKEKSPRREIFKKINRERLVEVKRERFGLVSLFTSFIDLHGLFDAKAILEKEELKCYYLTLRWGV